MPRRSAKTESKPPPPESNQADSNAFPTPSLSSPSLRFSYEIARGEQGVLTFEPYKSLLLSHWRFRSLPIAEESSQKLEGAFKEFLEKEDFVGADMARKFIQMGMTRAKRYVDVKVTVKEWNVCCVVIDEIWWGLGVMDKIRRHMRSC